MKKMIAPCITSLIISSSVYAASSKDLVKSTQSWNGAELPSINLKHPQVTIKEITIAPGERLPVHLHPVINVGILLEGKLRVYSEDKQKEPHQRLYHTLRVGLRPDQSNLYRSEAQDECGITS